MYLYYVDIVRYYHIGQWYIKRGDTNKLIIHIMIHTLATTTNVTTSLHFLTLILKRRFESAIAYSYRFLYFSKSLSLTIRLL